MSNLSPIAGLNLLLAARGSPADSGEASGLSNTQSFATLIADAANRVEAGEFLPSTAFGDDFAPAILTRLRELLQEPHAEDMAEKLLTLVDRDAPEQALLALLQEALASGDLLPSGGNSLPVLAGERALSPLSEERAVFAQNLLADLEKSGSAGSDAIYQRHINARQSFLAGGADAVSPDGEGFAGQLALNDKQLIGQVFGAPEAGSGTADKLAYSTLLVQSGQASAASINLMQQQLPAFAGEHRPSLRLTVPMGQLGWDAEMAGRIRWLVQNNIGSAEIRLNPPELGPIEVRIKTEGDQTSLFFTAHHAATRDALEQALPRLREAFTASGLQLADASVAEQGPRGGQQQQPSSSPTHSSFAGGELTEGGQAAGAAQPVVGAGLIDFYI